MVVTRYVVGLDMSEEDLNRVLDYCSKHEIGVVESELMDQPTTYEVSLEFSGIGKRTTFHPGILAIQEEHPGSKHTDLSAAVMDLHSSLSDRDEFRHRLAISNKNNSHTLIKGFY